MEPTDADAEEGRLRARWLEEWTGGATRRDEVLRALRSDGDGHVESKDLRGISLTGEGLEGIDFTGYDLSGADLTEANLTGARLAHCDLRRASLVRAKLDRCELLAANLADANLSECSAGHAGFGHADLSRATLFQANLEGATLTGAVLVGADLRAANLEKTRLRSADLRDINFTRARLLGADLCESVVAKSEFQNADLRDAELRGLQEFETASWIGVDIRDVNFSGAYLLRRWIMDENYLFEFRSKSKHNAFIYRVWWLTSDCGRSLRRWFAWNLAIALLFGFLYTIVAVDFGDHRTALSPFYFSFVTLTTLGYGDVVPASSAAQLTAVVEVLFGYLGLGGLLTIFAAKMGRRAD